MLNPFRRKPPIANIERLYGAIVAQARQPAFYTHYGVSDSVEGRFEMLLLHTFLVCHRLKAGGEAERAVSQLVFDTFLDDMDRTLREMGVGDLSVPKRMKKIGQAFYGRTAAFDRALAAGRDETGRDELVDVVRRNVFERDAPSAVPLADYIRAAVARLAAAPFEALRQGDLEFPVPDLKRAGNDGTENDGAGTGGGNA